jgi:hypothetical protein
MKITMFEPTFGITTEIIESQTKTTSLSLEFNDENICCTSDDFYQLQNNAAFDFWKQEK